MENIKIETGCLFVKDGKKYIVIGENGEVDSSRENEKNIYCFEYINSVRYPIEDKNCTFMGVRFKFEECKMFSKEDIIECDKWIGKTVDKELKSSFNYIKGYAYISLNNSEVGK